MSLQTPFITSYHDESHLHAECCWYMFPFYHIISASSSMHSPLWLVNIPSPLIRGVNPNSPAELPARQCLCGRLLERLDIVVLEIDF